MPPTISDVLVVESQQEVTGNACMDGWMYRIDLFHGRRRAPFLTVQNALKTHEVVLRSSVISLGWVAGHRCGHHVSNVRRQQMSFSVIKTFPMGVRPATPSFDGVVSCLSCPGYIDWNRSSSSKFALCGRKKLTNYRSRDEERTTKTVIDRFRNGYL